MKYIYMFDNIYGVVVVRLLLFLSIDTMEKEREREREREREEGRKKLNKFGRRI